jgi:hypothetical protein
MRYNQLFDDLRNFVPLVTNQKKKKIAVLQAEYSHSYNLDFTSYEFYARLLDIHSVCDDACGMRISRLSDETTQKTKHKSLITYTV